MDGSRDGSRAESAAGRVIRAADRPEEPLAGANGGVRVMIDSDSGARHVLQRVFRFGVGATPELENEASEDVMYIVDGLGTIEIGQAAYELAPGTGAFVPPGIPYVIENQGPHDLVVVSVLSPPPGSPPPDEPEEPLADHRYMVRQDEEPELSAGPGRSFRVLIDPRHGSRTVTQFVGTIERSGAPPHRHTYEEAVYVLGGDGVALIDGADHDIDPGDSAFLPPGTAHRLASRGREPLRILGVFSPPGSPASRDDLPAS
jgi:mannose-6-phosphate isomerase-like protein (cupin superfamily)